MFARAICGIFLEFGNVTNLCSAHSRTFGDVERALKFVRRPGDLRGIRGGETERVAFIRTRIPILVKTYKIFHPACLWSSVLGPNEIRSVARYVTSTRKN